MPAVPSTVPRFSSSMHLPLKKSKNSSPKQPAHRSSASTTKTASPARKTPAFKTPIPAKSESLPYAMTVATPTPVPSINSSQGILGWGMPAEVAFFVSLALLGLCLPLGIFFFMRRRKLQAQKSLQEGTYDSAENDSSTGTSTRPTTAGSWLEMLKHRTETPSPPHAGGRDDETYYEPPKPLNFARLRFYARRSGRMSAEDIEREVRELDEEVRRRSKMSKQVRASGVIPDVEDPCGECASAYVYDERGHTQPVEGRKGTPIPFLGSVELDGNCVEHKFKFEDLEEEDRARENEKVSHTENMHIEVFEDKVRL